MNLLFSFVIGQTYLSMLCSLQVRVLFPAPGPCPLACMPHSYQTSRMGSFCHAQWGVFLLFAACVFLMTLSVYLLFPETKGVPVEDCAFVFKHHWYWKRQAASAEPPSPCMHARYDPMLFFKMDHALGVLVPRVLMVFVCMLQVCKHQGPCLPAGASCWPEACGSVCWQGAHDHCTTCLLPAATACTMFNVCMHNCSPQAETGQEKKTDQSRGPAQ